MKNFLKHSGGQLGLLILIMSLVMVSSFWSTDISYLLKTSIVGYPEHQPFDGTVYPVQKVPDWSNLDASRYDLSYSSLNSNELVSTPYYDPSQLEVSADSLVWGNSADNVIRNAKITYSVAYMGSYNLDGKEYAGSHPAVDIKIPMGTPIYAMANGTVVKAVSQSSGFGNHIVLQHNNFPTLSNPNANETIYSSYSHMGNLSVSDGDTVRKGDQIGTSGNSGTATTPHLHFQIDNDSAPWHPYWPFTWQDCVDAGLDFFSAINAGLGQSDAIATTINPMKYTQKYLNGSAAPVEEVVTEPETYVPEVVEEPVVEVVEEPIVEEVIEEVVEEPVIEEVVLDPPVLQFDFAVSSKYYSDQEAEFTVLLRDQYGNKFEGFSGEVVVKSSQGLVTTKPSIVRTLDFGNDGVLHGEFTNLAGGKDRLVVEYDGQTFTSDQFEIVESGSGVVFTDLPNSHEYFTAVSYLVSEGVVAGYPDGSFKPDQTVSRVEAIKFIYEGLEQEIGEGNLPFFDTDKSQWYGRYLYTAYANGVVSGYPDGSFKPENTVNKAEFYKILFNGMGVDINPVVEDEPYKDVPVGEWFAPYIVYAKDIGLIDSDIKYLEPDRGMSRGEVAYAIYKLMQLMK